MPADACTDLHLVTGLAPPAHHTNAPAPPRRPPRSGGIGEKRLCRLPARRRAKLPVMRALVLACIVPATQSTWEPYRRAIQE